MIIEVSVKESLIKCIAIYDKNGLKVNLDLHLSSRYYEHMQLKNIFENTYIYSKEESKDILENHKNDTLSILKIYYELIGVSDNMG